MKETSLVVMAAGMGSRFGGMKQIAPLGPNGEIIIDYSVYDAVKAGFNKAVIIIKKAIEKDFREVAGKRIEKMIDVEYAFQELDKIPAGVETAQDREQPWGTGHAILCAREQIKTPFLVVNADDYYGQTVYKRMHDFLVNENDMCMAGYRLGNTLSDNGTVTRGICKDINGYLQEVIETHDIAKNTEIPLDSIVSMNMWGLRPDIFEYLEKEFDVFMRERGKELKSEFLLPEIIDKMIKKENAKVKVIPTDEVWYGVTYKEDAASVKSAISKLTGTGMYSGL